MCAPQRPLHLLLLDEPLADDLIDRGFHKRCTDGFALTIAFPEVGDELDVVPDRVLTTSNRYSVNGIPVDIPSSGIFRVVDRIDVRSR